MSELFSNDNIFLNVNVNSQNEAIEKAGKALVDSGAVTDAYIQAMKDQHLWEMAWQFLMAQMKLKQM